MENKLKEPKTICHHIYQQKSNSLATNGRLFFLIGFALACLVTVVAFEWKVYTVIEAVDITKSYEEKAIQLLPAPVVLKPKLAQVTPQIKKTITDQKFESEEDKGQLLIPQPKPLKVEQLIIEEVPDMDTDIEPDCCAPVKIDLPPPPPPITTDCGTGCCIPFVEQQPQPLGGYHRFYKYLGKHIKYPKKARRMGLEGKVWVEFVVERNGELTQFNVLDDIGGGCGQEAIRVLKEAPKWQPGKQRGVPVKVKYKVPVIFKMD